MEVIKTFTEEFLKAEALASDALIKPNLEDYNVKLAVMNSFCIEELHNKFGMLPLTELWDDELYQKWKDASLRNPRNIYKISHYNGKAYGDVFVIYVSGLNPNGRIFRYGECLFVTRIDGELKIIKSYTFGASMRIKKKFEGGVGFEDISFKILKKPIAVERYMEPVHDKDGMEHYLMEI